VGALKRVELEATKSRESRSEEKPKVPPVGIDLDPINRPRRQVMRYQAHAAQTLAS